MRRNCPRTTTIIDYLPSREELWKTAPLTLSRPRCAACPTVSSRWETPSLRCSQATPTEIPLVYAKPTLTSTSSTRTKTMTLAVLRTWLAARGTTRKTRWKITTSPCLKSWTCTKWSAKLELFTTTTTLVITKYHSLSYNSANTTLIIPIRFLQIK
jgi:hypothetical protein